MGSRHFQSEPNTAHCPKNFKSLKNMDLRTSLILSVAVIFMALVTSSFGIKCYQCNSMSEPKCGDTPDPFATHDGNGKFEIGSHGLTATDCPLVAGEAATMCRKIDQQIRGHVSVIRTCGVKEKYLMSDTEKANPLDEYNTVLQEYSTEVYKCEKDGCNGSPNLKISTFLAILTVLAALIH